VGALILFVYDVRWQKLPTAILTFCVVCAILVVAFGDAAGFCRVDFYGGILLLAGTYWVLYRVSGEKWVGSGDWLVALMCAVLLGDWVAALLCMLVANVLGCIVAVPMMARAGGKKKAAKMRLAMGPLLLAGFLVVFWFGEPLRALLGI
jgi:prepilin signal peptidase PulO-like enzyme (type II secretory pathway)